MRQRSPTDSKTVLEYAEKRRSYRRRVLLSMLFAILLGSTVFGLRYGRPTFDRLAYAYQWNRALDFRLPSDRVVYEEEPTQARALLHQRDYHVPAKVLLAKGWDHNPPAWWSPPACYTPRSLDRIITSEKYAVIWVHGRISPGKNARLVVVRCASFEFGSDGHEIVIYACPYSEGTAQTGIIPSAVQSPDIYLRLRYGTDHFRLFAGQADPQDPAHFTVHYQMNDQEGMIDGWLRDPSPGAPPSQMSVELRLHEPELFHTDLAPYMFKDQFDRLGLRLSELDANSGKGNRPSSHSFTRDFYNDRELRGAFVESVEKNSPADKAGIQPEDLMTMVGETIVQSEAEARVAFSKCGQSGSVPVKIISRKGYKVDSHIIMLGEIKGDANR